MRPLLLGVSLLAVLVIAASCTTTKTAEVAEAPESAPADTGADTEAAPAEPAGEETAGPKVVSVTTGDESDEQELQVTHETSEFSPTTPVIYCRVEVADVPVGAKVKGTLIGVSVTDAEGKTGEDIEIASKEVEAPQAAFPVTFSFNTNAGEWPVGEYKIEIAVDGETIDEVPMTCAK